MLFGQPPTFEIIKISVLSYQTDCYYTLKSTLLAEKEEARVIIKEMGNLLKDYPNNIELRTQLAELKKMVAY